MNDSRNKALYAHINNYHGKMNGKSQAIQYYKAKRNKKKLPTFKAKKPDQSDYKKLSIEEYEKKYS